MKVKDQKYFELVNKAVAIGLIPRYVYKYRRINENTKNIFTKSQLWFSNPNDFNDPFDCQLIVQADNTINEIANFLRQTAPNMSSKDIKMYSRHWSRNLHEWKVIVNKTVQENINKSGVCCFAGSNDNILMWSHYSDSHKGICIKFDLLADTDFFTVPWKVKYNANYPIYNHVRDSSEIVQLLIMTKAECWNYEQELRVVKQKFGLVNFKKESIVELTFGCCCNADHVKQIANLILDNRFPNIRLTKAVKSKSSYKLDIKNLK